MEDFSIKFPKNIGEAASSGHCIVNHFMLEYESDPLLDTFANFAAASASIVTQGIDDIVNSFLAKLQRSVNWDRKKRVLVLSSFLADKWEKGSKGIRQWIYKLVRFATYDLILLPVCTAAHWFLMAIEPKKNVQEYISEHEKHVPGGLFEWNSVQYLCSQQLDGNSCGIFTCMNAECLVKDVCLTVMRQHHVPYYREYVMKTLLAARNTVNCDSKLCLRPQLKCLEWKGCDGCLMCEHSVCTIIADKHPYCGLCLPLHYKN
ncbi:sentrin-specific protease 1-like [Gigantopelta aegis]|uniref:sentrin-specific protease 1-like n=1 Tax=Gigantopelta aegis TaxID=1735272 RepID=UPI001B88E631|nr:sentrin-specific protease 1-like [Gigantopelta aegis]